MAKTVVIVGAGYTGLPLAHKLLKYTVPKVPGLKIILISPNSHFYWNIAAVRGVIKGAIPDEQLFYSIADAFAQYSSNNFEFVLGKAESLDTTNNVVHTVSSDGTGRDIPYDHLVIASGSAIRSGLPFKSLGTHQATINALHSLQNEIHKANSIVVAGGGPTGVETVGELAAEYGSKKLITLVVGEKTVLHASKPIPSVIQTVEKDLQKLGVKVIHNTKVETAERKSEGGQVTISLSNGEQIFADCYMPLFGIQLNTSWVPPSLLDDSGNVKLETTMRVEGTENIWGIGDVGNRETKQLVATDAQIIHLAETLDFVLLGQSDKIKEHKPSDKQMIFISLGKRYATGQVGSWRLWGWMVSYVKGRKLFVDTAANYVSGKQLRHASM
ncbi:hypothetical protein ABW19_dt0210078 [Dactylella cylindrospora]|nr:hypothetical protein ABW19_dt0210078 [Dactylella cylindrospora]